ncbi:ribonuclease H-like domain-containing protein [Trichoderma sp. SZMC 28015]
MASTRGHIVIVNGSRGWGQGRRVSPFKGVSKEPGYTVVVDETKAAVACAATRGAANPAATTQWIDTIPALSKVVDALTGLPVDTPSLYVDLEGQNLSRHGTISILQIHFRPTNTTYLIDVQSLGSKCFSTSGETRWTLKAILESPYIPKVFFDVRSDSDALFVIFDITLNGVVDLQLMEFAVRSHQEKKWVQGLEKCVRYHATFSRFEKLRWSQTKERGKALFAPELGAFNQRPLAPVLLEYCAQDVSVMPCLWAYYDSRMTKQLREEVIAASTLRVWETHAPDYMSAGRHMALAPLSMIHASVVDDWRRLYESLHPRHGWCPSVTTASNGDTLVGSLFDSAASPASSASTPAS